MPFGWEAAEFVCLHCGVTYFTNNGIPVGTNGGLNIIQGYRKYT